MANISPVSYMECFPNKVFIGCLPVEATEYDLRKHFLKFGNIREVKIMRSIEGCSKGYAFITFETEEEADKIRKLGPEDLVIKGRRVNVGQAMKKHYATYMPYNPIWSPTSPFVYTYPYYMMSPGSFYASNFIPTSNMNNPCYLPQNNNVTNSLDQLASGRKLSFDVPQLEQQQQDNGNVNGVSSSVSLNASEFPPLQ